MPQCNAYYSTWVYVVRNVNKGHTARQFSEDFAVARRIPATGKLNRMSFFLRLVAEIPSLSIINSRVERPSSYTATLSRIFRWYLYAITHKVFDRFINVIYYINNLVD